MDPLLESFVAAMRRAAAADAPVRAVRNALQQALDEADAFAAIIAAQANDEAHLYEDDGLSVWTCRFHPGALIPPHEHRMPVHVGVVGGAERNILYRRRDGALAEAGEKLVGPGEVLSLGPEAIHSVTAAGDAPSLALHVYLGPLMQVERSLFDWDTGAPVPFTMANLQAMTRPV